MVKKRHLLLEELINEVADNPALWDKNHKEFKNVVTKTQVKKVFKATKLCGFFFRFSLRLGMTSLTR